MTEEDDTGNPRLAILLAMAMFVFVIDTSLMNVSISGTSLASMGMPMEFAGEDDLPTLVALTNSLLAAPVLLAPVLGGWLVDGAGYRGLFWVAIALLVAGWGTMRWAVREPRQAQAAESATRV